MGSATLSYSTQVFADDSFETAMRWAGRLGLSAVEIGKTHAIVMHESTDARDQARRLADETGVALASLHAWGMTEVLDCVCATTATVGAGLIVVHCSHEMLTEDFDSQADALNRYCDSCAEHGIVLTVENSSRQPIEPFLRLFQAVPELRLTLDVKHAYKPEALGLTHLDYMNALGDRVANFHMLGIDPARDGDLGDGIPAGNDPPKFSWRQLAGDLQQRGYDGLITAECSIHVDPADENRLYYDLPPADETAPALAHRLSRHNVAFFGEVFRAVLARPVPATRASD